MLRGVTCDKPPPLWPAMSICSTATPKGPTVVWGAKNIARVLNCPTRAVFRLAELKRIPVKHVGRQLVSTEEALLKAIEAGLVEEVA